MKRKLLSLFLALSLILASASSALAYTPEEQVQIVEEVIEFIKEYGLTSSQDDDPLRNGLLKLFSENPDAFAQLMDSMLSSYDSHSMFLPEGTYTQAFPSNGSYVGVGITMEQAGDEVRVAGLAEGGSAQQVGVQVGDILVQVSNQPLAGKTMAEVGALLRGEEGTQVSLTVRRQGKLLTFVLTRTYIGVPNFTSKVLEDGVYYMNFARFQDDETYLQFVFALQEMWKSNSRALILDLRDNPGGDVQMALNIINRLLPVKTPFFGMASRNGGDKFYQGFTSDGIGVDLNKIIILSNENSASASEIIQVSLCDLGYAVSVGAQTYGKARGQYHMTFTDGSAAVLTSVELIAPSTGDYEGVGLTPDYPVANRVLPHPASQAQKLSESAVAYGATGPAAKALDQALIALGYLEKAEALGVFDDATQRALDGFRAERALQAAPGLDAKTAAAINKALAAYEGKKIEMDDQLDKALELAREYAKEPQKYWVDDLGNFWNLNDGEEQEAAS